MMRRHIALALCFCGCALAARNLPAETVGIGIIPRPVAQRYGLERAWFTQVRLDPKAGGILDMKLHVSARRSETTFQVTADNGEKFYYSERNLNTFGEPMGVEGAGKAAAERVRVLRLDGIESTIEQLVIPEITLYVTTDRGMVHAIDAENGQTRWTSGVGQSKYPSVPAAVSEHVVAVANGQSLFVLDAVDGSPMYERRTGKAAAAGLTIANNIIYVPMINGYVDAFAFGKGSVPWPETFRSRGRIHFHPSVAGDYIVWPNDSGDITAITVGRSGIRYRVRLPDMVAGPIIYNPPNQILAATSKGELYSFGVEKGDLQWRISTGNETAEPATCVGDTIYLISRDAGVHAVDTVTGEEKWWSGHSRRFIAASNSKVYTTAATGQVVVLDKQTGTVLSQIPINVTDRVFVNNQTDRFYVATRSGVVQCLHEIGADWPTIHVPSTEQAPAEESGKQQEDAEGGEDAGPVDPFGGGAEGAGAAKPDANPFATDAAAAPAGKPKTEPAKEADNPFK